MWTLTEVLLVAIVVGAVAFTLGLSVGYAQGVVDEARLRGDDQ